MDLLKNLNIDKIRNAAEDVINQAKPKTDVEARIYEALSHKNWGSSSTLMNEIARDTFDYDRFHTVTRILWESLDNPRPAAWRVVFKGLTLLEHLVKNGSERCVDDGRNHSHLLRSLFNFNYYEGTVDRGQGVREKAKQVVELISDDERIREERIKAKQLREKFGGNLGGVSNFGSGGGMTGIGGGGGSSFAGYGNDSENYGGYGGSGSYGNSGIGSSGGYHDYANSSEKTSNNFSGRYADETSGSTATVPTPTFAELPDKKNKKKKKSKTKKKETAEEEAVPAPAPAGPEIDLLALDDDPAPPVEDNSFDAFQSAPMAQIDEFDAFQTTAPTSGSLQTADSDGVFDAFQSATEPKQATSNTFDAFGTHNVMMNHVNDAFGNMNMTGFGHGVGGVSSNAAGIPQKMNNFMNPVTMNSTAGHVVSTQQQQQRMQPSASHDDDDNFGDFDDGKSKNVPRVDPLSNLISLDSLTKNKKKEDDKTNEPIAYNNAAKQYIQNAAQRNEGLGTSKIAADMAFSGVDGIHKQPTIVSNTNRMSSGAQSGKPVMNVGGGNSMIDNIGVSGFGGMNQGTFHQQSSSVGFQTNMSMGNSTSMGGVSQPQGMMGGMGQYGGMMGGGMSQMGGTMNSGVGQFSGMMGGAHQQQGGMMGGVHQQQGGMMMNNANLQQGGMMMNNANLQQSGMMSVMKQQYGGMVNASNMGNAAGMYQQGGMNKNNNDNNFGQTGTLGYSGGMMNNGMGGNGTMGSAWQ